MKFTFDRALGRTVLFSVAVVALVIGVYETIVLNSLEGISRNYWLFMVSFACMMWYRYLGQTKTDAPNTDVPAKAVPPKSQARKPAPRKKGRR